ncbi:hypothetical protein [Sphingomonas segetis]|uniref:hypothetical protein n=1 Tax=Sphingomonas segetis TaxID=1104779 RepID=UPI001E4099AE|nr:hypothetical protein [Sphingomonas segetis]
MIMIGRSVTSDAGTWIWGNLSMSDNRPNDDVDVTKEWRATQGQKSAATRLRIFAAVSWVIAIGAEIAGVVLLYRHKFDHGNLPLLIGILVGIAIFAIVGSLLWKAANKHDPARESDSAKFFFQNQLGAIITVIAFLPLIVLIFMDKDMDPKNKKIAGGLGVVLAVIATLIGVSWNPPSVEQYTQDMNQCADQIKTGQPTTACSPEVAEQAKDIARDSKTVADATKDAAHPAGQDVVYWIAPENGAKKSSTPHVFHICGGVSPLRGKTVNSGSVTEAYAENATRITKQIPMEQKQCGFAGAKEAESVGSTAG